MFLFIFGIEQVMQIKPTKDHIIFQTISSNRFMVYDIGRIAGIWHCIFTQDNWYCLYLDTCNYLDKSYDNFTILAITCRRPLVSNETRLEPEEKLYRYNEVITFSCIDGFTLTGQTKKYCKQNGDFQYNVPNCTGNIILRPHKLEL